jgi:hypothetical protein
MGACGGKELTAEQKKRLSQSRSRDSALRADANLDSQKVKLLLLGAGESGKSTIFKQMKIIYGMYYHLKTLCILNYPPTIPISPNMTTRGLTQLLRDFGARASESSNTSGQASNGAISCDLDEEILFKH